MMYPDMTANQRDQIVRANFINAFADYVEQNKSYIDQRLLTLAIGPRKEINRYKGHCVNGYKFDTRRGRGEMTTFNSGVWLQGSYYANNEQLDYYGVLEEIWELRYNGLNENVVLFKCSWFDNGRGMQVHPKNGIVQIKFNRKSSIDDPFILASQAKQVFYLNYVSDDKRRLEWVVAIKTFPRNRIDWSNLEITDDDDAEFFQQGEQPVPCVVQPTVELDNQNILVAAGLYDVEEVEQGYKSEEANENDKDDEEEPDDEDEDEDEEEY